MDGDAADTYTQYARNGKVMLGSAVLLVLIVLIIVFFHTYVHSCFRRRRRYLLRTRRFNLTSPTTTVAATSTYDKGLDPSLLKFLPTFTYSSATHRPLQECAICLSDFEDGDEGRLLPNCNHPFHSLCIDTWFSSHCNCPLCRIPVQPHEISSVLACSNTKSLFSEAQIEKGDAGCSSLPPPIGCPRKPLEVVGLGMAGVIVELPVEEEERLSGSEEWWGRR